MEPQNNDIHYVDYPTQLEHLDQQITLTLQEIDREFASCYDVVATKMIPKLHKFNASSKQMVKLSENWLNFFNRLRYESSPPASPVPNQTGNFDQYRFDDPRISGHPTDPSRVDAISTPHQVRNQRAYVNEDAGSLINNSPYFANNRNQGQFSILEDDSNSVGSVPMDLSTDGSQFGVPPNVTSTPIALHAGLGRNPRTPSRATPIASSAQNPNASTNRPPPVPSRPTNFAQRPFNPDKGSVIQLTDLDMITPSFLDQNRNQGRKPPNSNEPRAHHSLGSLTFSNSILPQNNRAHPQQANNQDGRPLGSIPEGNNDLDELESKNFELPSFINEYTSKPKDSQ